MFNPNRIVIDAFVVDALARYRQAFPRPEPDYEAALEEAARTALETLLLCDCPYHDLHHTLMVADAGQAILRGRLIGQGDVSQRDWLQALVAMLFHDVGYIRGVLSLDNANSYLADETGARVTLPPGATDASLMPYHVVRGCMYLHERFADHPVIDVTTVAGHIEMTRFPVPAEASYQRLDTFAALVRAADLIGQMGDPAYPRKVSGLYAEFLETGEAERLGYHNADELRADFADFFHDQVYPYVTEGLRHLERTDEGQQWVASLFHHVRASTEADAIAGTAPALRPHIAVSNR